jgi:general secretion pathway protein D
MPMQTRLWLLVCLGAILLAGTVCAQQAPTRPMPGPRALPPQLAGAAAAPIKSEDLPDGMIRINFPDTVTVQVLLDYVGLRQGINFIYEKGQVARPLTIKAPQAIPADSVMDLLKSVLRIHGLAMTQTAVPDTYRVQAAQKLPLISPGPETGPPTDRGQVVSRVVVLEHISTKRAEEVLANFIPPTGGGSILQLPEHDRLIITDYADSLARLENVIALIDRPQREVAVRFVHVTHQEATSVSQSVTQMLAAMDKARTGGAAAAPARLSVIADERANRVALVGPPDSVKKAEELVKTLDTSLGLETKLYRFGSTSAERVDEIVQAMIGEQAAKRLYRSSFDEQANMLIATATSDIHKQIEDIRRLMDVPVDDKQSPIRFYKLENAKASQVLTTLQGLEGDGGLSDISVDGVSGDPAGNEVAYRGPTPEEVNPGAPVAQDAVRGGPASLPEARVLADEATNTIIVVASPAMHPVYEKLIRKLDERQPQVLIEATVVSVDTSNNFQLGVEIHSRETGVNGGELFNFSQFGLSTRNATTGQFTLNPGTGFTGALLNADVAEVVIRALETDTRVKVVSRPSVLVNSNQEGTLESKSEEPYTTTNASGVAGATTSFGGFASAGTEVKITPQISEGDYLKLKYSITLSSFGDNGTDILPPSRQTNNLASEVTIPDGATIVVGGLTRETFNETVDRIPFLGSIPIIEHLFSSRNNTKSKATLFVFIKAVVLRDDKFKDLKMLSTTAAGQAELAADFPVSEPVSIQ